MPITESRVASQLRYNNATLPHFTAGKWEQIQLQPFRFHPNIIAYHLIFHTQFTGWFHIHYTESWLLSKSRRMCVSQQCVVATQGYIISTPTGRDIIDHSRSSCRWGGKQAKQQKRLRMTTHLRTTRSPTSCWTWSGMRASTATTKRSPLGSPIWPISVCATSSKTCAKAIPIRSPALSIRGSGPSEKTATSKLAQLYDQMMDFVNERLPVAKKILEMSVQQPLKKAALSAAEKNKMLNERRCKTWLPAEEEARNKVTSSDISLLKQYYCNMEGLNPFQLPPSTMTLPDSV